MNFKSRARLSLFLLLFTSVSLWAASPSVDQVTIDSGSLKGEIDGNIVSFKGIPFAAPPVGNLRWQPPQPVAPWTGVRAANKYGSDCMQAPYRANLGEVTFNEDCLYLNVWAPVARGPKPLPVMVWIYGGGFVIGGTSLYSHDNGAPSAKRGVVFVNLNYRLGRFGFFAHQALSAENPKGPLGNYGFMDQIAALKWVQKNISAFGGDPNNVTIMGESAGGASVLTLLTSPVARGLFHRAVVQSGGGRELLMGARHITNKLPGDVLSAEEVGVNFARSVGITGTGAEAANALRNLPAEKVLSGLGIATVNQSAQTYSGPMIDGNIVRETPQSALLAGRFAKVPVMVGANDADIGFPSARTFDELFMPFGASGEKAKAAFDPENSKDLQSVGLRIASDQVMVEPARFVARAVAAAGARSFEYRFSYVAESARQSAKGAAHASEVPFVLGTARGPYGDRMTKQDEAIEQQAHTYWVNFASNGDPNGEGLPKWPAYNPKTDVLLDFTLKGPIAVADPWKSRLDLVEALLSQ